VTDPHLFNADPDPAFHLKADPDTAFHFNAHPDTDPAPHQSDGGPRPPWLCCEPITLMNFDFVRGLGIVCLQTGFPIFHLNTGKLFCNLLQATDIFIHHISPNIFNGIGCWF
jgi:hypothetical protein